MQGLWRGGTWGCRHAWRVAWVQRGLIPLSWHDHTVLDAQARSIRCRLTV